MFACQWHFDVPFGKQKDALAILKEWEPTMRKSPAYPKDRGARLMVGHIGASPSHIIAEHVFDSVADWEKMMHDVATGKYQSQSEKMAALIVPGSQHWEILKIVE